VACAHRERPRHDAQPVALLDLAREVGPAAGVERGLRHLPHAPHQPALGAADEQHAAVALDERRGHRHVDGARRPRLSGSSSTSPRARASQRWRSGHAGQAGLRGRQIVAPSSISAWFQSPGPLGLEQLLRAVVVRAVLAERGPA
jgi:hypothetical protein